MLDHMRFAPDPVSQMLGSDYLRFVSDAGVHGLCKVVNDSELHILAVSALSPGTGQFRKFMGLCKAELGSIYVWELMNTRLSTTLERHGFTACEAVERGEKLTGMKWSRP